MEEVELKDSLPQHCRNSSTVDPLSDDNGILRMTEQGRSIGRILCGFKCLGDLWARVVFYEAKKRTFALQVSCPNDVGEYSWGSSIGRYFLMLQNMLHYCDQTTRGRRGELHGQPQELVGPWDEEH
jgi:hypothetical protein